MSDLTLRAAKQAKEYQEVEPGNLDSYLDFCFRCLVELKADEAGCEPDEIHHNSFASISGTMFETYVSQVFDELYPSLDIEHQIEIEEAYMTGSAAADSVIKSSGGEILAVIESKGAPPDGQYRTIDGEVIHETTQAPGMGRSDTVKKAVCQCYQVYSTTDYLPIIFTMKKPKPGSTSEGIIEIATGDILGGMFDISKIEELENFIALLEDKCDVEIDERYSEDTKDE